MVFARASRWLLISENAFHGHHSAGVDVTEKHGDLAVRVPGL